MPSGQTKAMLKWEAACERLRFALDHPARASDEVLNLEESFRSVSEALEDLRQAFLPESPPP